ncbi:hypothetical protein AOLI_G00187590 [Acnodon oligacanthus]
MRFSFLSFYPFIKFHPSGRWRRLGFQEERRPIQRERREGKLVPQKMLLKPLAWEFNEAEKTAALSFQARFPKPISHSQSSAGKISSAPPPPPPGAAICWLSTSKRAESASKTWRKGLAGQLLAYIIRLAHGALPARESRSNH